MRTIAKGALAALAVAACVNTAEPPPDHLPEGYTGYRIAPTLLQYHYVDSSSFPPVELTWLSDRGMYGYNCLGFRPNTPSDTVGRFAFVWNGSNTGEGRRTYEGVTDTTVFFFLSGLEGTGGTYVVNAAQELTLTWSDGIPSRYFDPSAQMHFSGDTLWSIADLRSHGDSIRAQWTVAWVRDPC